MVGANTYGDSSLPDADECHSDGDCTENAYGYCVPGNEQYGTTPTPNRCAYGCTVDVECDEGSICVCTETRGECRPAGCGTDGACGPDSLCAEYAPGCQKASGFSCLAPDDECVVDEDCDSGLVCGTRTDGTRYCTLGYCAA